MIDAEEMRTIITENNERLYKYCLRITGDKSAAEDVASDVWLVIIRKRSHLRPGDDIRAYIYRVADKCILKWRSATARRAAHEGPLEYAEGLSGPPEDFFESGAGREKSDAELLEELAEKLPEESRELFRLRFIEKRRLEDIVRITKTPYSTVRLRIGKIADQAAKIIRNGDHYG